MKGVALIIIALGVIGLAYGGFTYTKSTSTAQIGPIDIVTHDRERVNIPIWAGIAAIVVGAGILLVPGKNA
jgi:drug/metabolite transporter (DMT)-like permease